MPIITGLNISSDGGRTWRAPQTKNSRVEVVVPPYSQELTGFSATPTESHKS